MRTLTVKDGTSPRLDGYLLASFPALHSGQLYKFLRENKIKLNGKKAPLNTHLMPGDVIHLYLPDELLEAEAEEDFMRAKQHFAVVYEDENVLLADKPAGIACIDEDGANDDTLINRALRYLYEKKQWNPNDKFAPELCHRLDTGTSGLVLIAKTPAALQALEQLIKDRAITKKYLCVTVGHPEPENAVLKGYLAKDAARGKVTVTTRKTTGARDVVTKYRTLKQSGRLALLEVELITGRTHQIRAHMASIHCPILGDSKYGINTINRSYKAKYQALCAYSLTFPILQDASVRALSGKTFHVQKPWYAKQIIDGTLK